MTSIKFRQIKQGEKPLTSDVLPSDFYNRHYEGYLWYSNAQKPNLLEDDLLKHDFTQMPFIIEGNLYCEEAGISIQIKCIDGVYYITEMDVSFVGQETIKQYLAHRVGHKYYQMYEHWEKVEDKDNSLANMPTMQATWSAFMGFSNNQKSK